MHAGVRVHVAPVLLISSSHPRIVGIHCDDLPQRWAYCMEVPQIPLDLDSRNSASLTPPSMKSSEPLF